MWCYRRMLKIKFADQVANEKVWESMTVKEEDNLAMDLAKGKFR